MPRIQYETKNIGQTKIDLIDQADTICRSYAAQGYDLTLRQLYYQFVARGLIPNTQRSYKRLGAAVNDGRMLGLLDWDHITDRTRNLASLPSWGSPDEIVKSAARQYRRDKWATQSNRVEVWVEKEALAGVIEQACNPLQVDFFSCRGYVSQSEMWAAGQRLFGYLEDGHERVTILHLGDHDPSGIDMSRDIEDRLWGFMGYDMEQQGIPDDALVVDRIALNMVQVRLLNPPPNPAKLTDSRSSDYVDRYGYQSWELDALDPATLNQLVTDAVLALRDQAAWDAELATETAERALIQTAADSM